MPDPLLALIDVAVTDVETPHDYVQIVFGDICLTINNSITTDNIESVYELVGRCLRSVVTDRQKISFTFSGDARLDVDMSDEAFICPEAMVLTRPDAPTVVWQGDD